ncbi:DUF4336 domain-containing protein [Paracraurococcus lichenis]|uniref:DUF4336 domain-containing protein n=1 Tax=Paracraurococcus lichenis TaxID=3064888 RepID=A0ABT9DUG1_9PROT|nr:DUF4336 domain-containing protein [Paracraurococcus sp. LOR1-02]MDO9707543.1 DUF4336 domain-containing protein [Paracraurococcus sp. LOR1-02]
MTRDGTYPPLDTPKAAAEGVWVVDSGPQRLLGLPVPIRMTVLRLADGGLWLHSPVGYSPALAAALQALGPIRHLVSPGTAHWLHLQAWQAAVPEARLWAPHGVVERARDQGAALRAHGVLGPEPPADWAGQIDHEILRGAGFVEVAFFHRASRTLLLCDTVQAMEPARLPLAAGLLVRALGAPGPEGGTPRHVRLVLSRYRGHNREAVGRLLALDPARVVFAHGAWFESEGAARLRRAFGWLLG